VRCIADTAPRPGGTFLPPPPTTTRGFKTRDVPVIAEIVADALHEHYDPSLYTSLSQQWPDGFLIVADEADRPMGFLLGVSQVAGEARVLMFAVSRRYRNTGVGSHLMDTFLERSRLRGLHRVTLEVRVSNTTAIRFYTRYQFSVTDLLRAYYSDGENGYQMAREVG
jgi:ribosomal protein S18 acetylase RimI-like enzyme